MNLQLPKMRNITEGASIKRRFVLSYMYVHFAVSEPFWEESFEENMYFEEPEGYLLFHCTCHPHISRYRWVQTTQYRSCEETLRGCIEIHVARLSRKYCREGLVASDLQEKTGRRSKTKVTNNGGIKRPQTPSKMIISRFCQRDLYSARSYSMILHTSIHAARRRGVFRVRTVQHFQ